MQHRDLNAIVASLAPQPVYVVPMSFSGQPQPEFTLSEKDDIGGYFQRLFERFESLRFDNVEISIAEGGRAAFIETEGFLLRPNNQAPYQNVYVFKLAFDDDGKISRVVMYTNPVPAAPILGRKLGPSSP